ncbi:MAG: hypothetical protein HZB51_21510 [Chloroflexi bacterium]|nr:hypothetical protein [Chloroflexota bacterium]
MLLDWVLLLPIFFPLVGALILAPIAPKTPARIRIWLPFVYLLIEIILITVNAAPGLHRLTVSEWELASFSIVLQMDAITWLLFLMTFVPLAAIWFIAAPRKPFDLLAILVLTSALLVLSAANLITAYIAWTLLDVFIFLWRMTRNIEPETTPRSMTIGLLSGLFLFAGAILVSTKQPNGEVLIAVAFWARLGLFPFHHLLPTHGADPFDLWFARGIPLIAASNLWLHWSTIGRDAPVTLIGTLVVAALIALINWIWRAIMLDSNSDSAMHVPTRAAEISLSSAFALVPLTITLGGNAGVALALWLTLAAVLAMALFEMAHRWRADSLNRWHRLIWFAALFALAGLPLTPAFLGRIGLYVALWETNNGFIMLTVGIATLILLAPMWNIGLALKAGELREPRRIEYAGLVLITLVGLALSFGPTLIASALSPAVAESYERSIDLVIRTNDALGVGLAILTLIVPVIGSYFLSHRLQRFRPRPDAMVLRLARFMDLDWLGNLSMGIGLRVAAIARGATAIAEENPTIWILFMAMWVAIFIMLFR